MDYRFRLWGRPICHRKTIIREAYRDYTPEVDAAAIVEQLLGTVPDKYLRGLDCVVLTNAASLSRKDRVGGVWSRNRKFDKSRILGRYYPRASDRSPYIELRVDKIINSLKGMQLHIPFMRKLMFGSVLIHELGHHIHRTIRPEHKEKEDVADSWAPGQFRANAILVRASHANSRSHDIQIRKE